MGVLKKKLSFFLIVEQKLQLLFNTASKKAINQPKTIKQFQLHKHDSLLYCNLSTNTAPLPFNAHTQTPRFNHNLNRGTGLAQVLPAIGIPSKKVRNAPWDKVWKDCPVQSNAFQQRWGLVVGRFGRWWVLRWEVMKKLYGVFLVAQVGEGSCFFLHEGGVSKDSVFLWMPESSWRILSEPGPTTGPTTWCDSGRTAATAQSFATTWRGQRSRWGSTRSTKHSWLEKGGTLNESMYSYWKSGDIPASYVSC